MTDAVPPPVMRSYGRQVFLCIHGDCAPVQDVLPLQERLMALARAHGLTKLRNPERLKCTLADCLGVCKSGPIMVVYPEGLWYHRVDAEALERIFHQHLLGGQPVEDLLFHHLYPPGQEPAYAPLVRGDEPFAEVGGPDLLAQEEEILPPSPFEATASDDEDLPEGNEAQYKEKAARRQASYLRKKASATREKGLIIVHTGPGKGKTTASLGLAFRALGQGMSVGMVQFIKGAIPTGEAALIKRLDLPITLYTMGDGFTWNTQNRDQDIASTRQAWAQAQTLLGDPTVDMVILDELNVVLRYGYVPLAEVLDVLRRKRPSLHVVITGRNANPALLEMADLVTEMKAVKHPYRAGVKAQTGIEF